MAILSSLFVCFLGLLFMLSSCIPFFFLSFSVVHPIFSAFNTRIDSTFFVCCLVGCCVCVCVSRREANSKFNNKKSKSNPFRWKTFQCKITHIVTNLTCGVSQWQNGNNPTKQYLHVHCITHFFTDIPINHLALALGRPIRRRSDTLHEYKHKRQY